MEDDKKRFAVIALHPWVECNLKCSFCYRNKNQEGQLRFEFFKELIPYLGKYTNQVAIGGGEPFFFPEQIKELTRLCKENGMIANITSNGKLLMPMDDERLKDLLQYTTMLSLSFDGEKIKTKEDVEDYFKLVNRISNGKMCRVGCNLLIDDLMMVSPQRFIGIVGSIMRRVERVFALYPKNFEGPDILKPEIRGAYFVLSKMYEHFYVDDLTNKILAEKSYGKWKHPCHFGELLSIDEIGAVRGCSFDKEPLLTLEKPEDINKIDNIEIPKRYNCPYLTRGCKDDD